jgi:hypothetical protein
MFKKVGSRMQSTTKQAESMQNTSQQSEEFNICRVQAECNIQASKQEE